VRECNSHYARSTLERLESIHLAYGADAAGLFHYYMLDTQYRMPPAIGDLVSAFSYRGLLKTQYGADVWRRVIGARDDTRSDSL
jgi:superfamily I DNA and/or RNA helicase